MIDRALAATMMHEIFAFDDLKNAEFERNYFQVSFDYILKVIIVILFQAMMNFSRILI